MHNRTLHLAITAFLTAALTMACGSGEAGNPTAAPTEPAPATEQTTEQASNPLDDVQACDLLTDDEAATISPGLEREDKGPMGTSSSCVWSSSIDRGVPVDDGITFGIDIRPRQPVDELHRFEKGGGAVTTGAVNGREAIRVAHLAGVEGGCLIGLAVGEGVVDINVERVRKQTERACADASAIAEFVEPRLPPG